MGFATKEQLLGRQPADLPTDIVPVPGMGDVEVRALSRGEALLLPEDTLLREAEILSLGMLDPEMTRDEVLQWMACSPAGEAQDVSQKIAVLSGLMEDSAKAAYKSDGDGPEPGV